jgi:hypothetical protein
MNFTFLSRVCRIAAIGAILLGSASCIAINEELGENLIPTDQKWDVFPQEPVVLEDIRLEMADSLSAYSTTRFTFGAVNDGSALGTTKKASSMTLVPIWDSLDFGRNTKIRQFHFTAVRDTLSTVYDNEQRILQNVYVSELRKPLDSTIIYTSSLSNPETLNEYVDLSRRITAGVPVYSGGDSLSFDFSLEFAEKVWKQIDKAQRDGQMDSVSNYLKYVPGIYFSTDAPAGNGGRINMFKLGVNNSSGYLTGNYAELKITAEYDYSDEPVDTSFVFIFGPGDFVRYDEESGSITYPNQFAFNASDHDTAKDYPSGAVATDKIYVEGGGGLKPVVKAEEIKQILERLIAQEGIKDPSQVVVNKATIVLPYDVEGDYDRLEKYPDILSPTVRLHSTDGVYVTYAGLTDSSISTENQGDINRSLSVYSPDISHHVQEILKLDRNDKDYSKNIENYDIWFLIMHQEIVEDTTYDSSYNDYYNNLYYNSYYNNMMYDPYGYGGYGYGGYGGYGYGGYGGYGYSNYYNYAMMAYYSSMYSSSSSSSTEYTTELDKDRFYNGILNGPQSSGAKPQFKVTFSAPKSAE